MARSAIINVWPKKDVGHTDKYMVKLEEEEL